MLAPLVVMAIPRAINVLKYATDKAFYSSLWGRKERESKARGQSGSIEYIPIFFTPPMFAKLSSENQQHVKDAIGLARHTKWADRTISRGKEGAWPTDGHTVLFAFGDGELEHFAAVNPSLLAWLLDALSEAARVRAL